MALFLIIVGLLVNFAAGIALVVAAFRKSVGWGLACLFLPFAALIFVIQNWQETKTAFFASVGGLILALLGMLATPHTDPQSQVASTNSVQASTVQATPQRYEPPRSAYSPPPAYVPPAPAPVTTTVVEEKKRTLEMVYIDRDNRTFYSEKCRKKPQNVARVAKSVALMQGYTPARCGS